MKFIYSISAGLLSLFCSTNHLHLHAIPAPPVLALRPPALPKPASVIAHDPGPDTPPHHRPGLPLKTIANVLGPLANLVGTWVGNGFILISLPDFSSIPPSTGPAPF